MHNDNDLSQPYAGEFVENVTTSGTGARDNLDTLTGPELNRYGRYLVQL